MKTLNEIPNYRVIKATFVSPTNSRGSRVKLFESARFNDDKTESKIFSYDYEHDSVLGQSLAILERNDMKVICRGYERDYYYFMCDNWGGEFKHVNELK